MGEKGVEMRRLGAVAAKEMRLSREELEATGIDAEAEETPEIPLEEQEPGTWGKLKEQIGPITWAWEGWLPNNMVTILAGQPGCGKSALALRIAATFLRGDPWPDGTPCDGGVGKVLWAEAEAAQAVNLSRAEEWGLDLDDILTPFHDTTRDIRLDGLEGKIILRERAQRDDVRLVVVDSLRGVHRRDENQSESSGVVLWLAAVARDCHTPILLTHHLRKRGLMDGEGITLERLRGSSAIVQAARVVWVLDTPDPRQPNRLRLANVKNNLCRFPEPIGFEFGNDGLHFGDAPEPPRQESQVDKACDLLEALLAKGPLYSTEVEEEAKGAAISWRTINRAKARLRIVAVRKKGRWLWSLPVLGEIRG